MKTVKKPTYKYWRDKDNIYRSKGNKVDLWNDWETCLCWCESWNFSLNKIKERYRATHITKVQARKEGVEVC